MRGGPAARSSALPAPLGGWNARDPIENMPVTDAIRLVNVFPDTDYCRLRTGYRVHATGMGSGSVKTLAEYAGPTGTRKLVAGGNGNLYDATTYNAAATSLSSGYSVDYWQTVNYRGVMILVNGTDSPVQYNGTATSAANYTGVADDNKLIDVTVYKTRLYFVEKDTASMWYGAVNTITGALTEYNFGGIFTKGGFIKWISSWSADTGSGLQNVLVVCSNMGEVLVYSGDYPGASDWTIQGRYYLPVPLSIRSKIHIGPDLLVLHQDGITPLSDVLSQKDATNQYSRITDKINKAFREAVRLYSASQPWEMAVYPRAHWLLINIPISNYGTTHQYVANSLTGSWCQFKGMNAASWGMLNEKLYFGGNDGKIYEADYAYDDNGAAINVDIKTAFTYLGDRAHNKRFSLVKPIMVSDAAFRFKLGIDVDYADRATETTASFITSTGSAWDSSPWETTPWDTGNVRTIRPYVVNGIGRCMAVKVGGQFKSLSFSLAAFDVIYERGGFL